MNKEAVFTVPLLILSFSLLSLADPILLRRYCLESEMSNSRSMENSSFDQNLKNVLQSLISNTPSTGFNETSIGDVSDGVYGQALCRGDVNTAECQKCLESANQGITKCQTKEAIIWYDLCQIHYSFQDFFHLMVYTGKEPDQNYKRSVVSQADQLRKTMRELIKRLSEEAAYGDPNIMFSTGDSEDSLKRKIYGLVQCTRDITPRDCKSCLTSAFGDLDPCCSAKEGGIIFSRNCNVRFELRPFYNSSTSQGN